MIAYALFAFNHRLNEDNSLDKKSDVIGDLSYMIAARITRYMVVKRRRQLTFTIIYRRVIKFSVAAEGHNPGTNKVHIKQAPRITASFTRIRLNFWNRCQSHEVVHPGINCYLRNKLKCLGCALQPNKLTKCHVIELKFLS